MEDYYALLGVDPKAEPAEIRRAFRKAALVWHPDRNNNSPEATQKYQVLQEAYDCLSDPQERAWYDRHRVELLTGVRDRHGYTDACDKVSLEEYFDDLGNVQLAFSFQRGSTNFYSVVADLFEAILRDEEAHVRVAAEVARQNPDRVAKERLSCPPFGDENTPWRQVSAWYQFWHRFETAKTFAWADMWDPALGETRWVRKQARIENKQARAREANRYNERIQSLRRFVKEHDPRVRQQHAAAEVAETQRREQAEARQRELEEQRQEAKRQRRLAAEAEMARMVQRAREAGLTVEEFEEANGLGHGRTTEPIEALWRDDGGNGGEDELEPVPKDLAAAGCQIRGGQYHCRHCHTDMKTLGMFRTHMASRKHRAALDKSGASSPAESGARTPKKEVEKPPRDKARRRKEATAMPGPEPVPESTPGAVDCKTCGRKFASRNKLFEHLKATGHAAYR